MTYRTKIIKIGNSLGFILPQIIAKSFGWKIGDEISFEVKNGKLLLRKVDLKE